MMITAKISAGLKLSVRPVESILFRSFSGSGSRLSDHQQPEASGYSSDSERSENESEEEVAGKLYDHHIPTTFLQKCLLAVGSSATALLDPYRDDMVAVFGETTGCVALNKVHKHMKANDEGKSILMEKPVINSTTVDFDKLSTLPENTIGYQYSNFLKTNKISSDTRKPVKFIDDVQLAYVMQRYRETHDLVHALLQMKTNMLGEVTVKWVEAIQTDLPMCWSGALLGATRLAPKQRTNYVKVYLPWALRCGHQSKLLLNVYFEKRWEQDADDLRRELNIPALPDLL